MGSLSEFPEVLETFSFEGQHRPVIYVESQTVADGVRCDVYAFAGTDALDLGVIHLDEGCSTPRQRVVGGDRTVEGFLRGRASLRIEVAGLRTIHRLSDADAGRSFVVPNGGIMQWVAEEPSVVFEVCHPPYAEGRFEDLKD